MSILLSLVGSNISTSSSVASWSDVSTASFVRFDTVNAGGDVRGIFFKPDGTKVYTVNQSRQLIETTLPTAWDISSHGARDYRFYTNSTFNPNPVGIFFKPDGTGLYVADLSNSSINQYTLSTGWDLSTVSWTRVASVSTFENNLRGISFSPDGTMVFVQGMGSDTIKRIDLSTAWDISTLGSTTSSAGSSIFASPINESAGLGMFMKPDGTRFYIVGNVANKIYQWNATTAYDVSMVSPTIDDSLTVTAQETTPWSMYISPDGSHLYVGGGSGNGIDQYSL